jgi:23S rRNA (guanosine2251-2'-O)-methyltransferase
LQNNRKPYPKPTNLIYGRMPVLEALLSDKPIDKILLQLNATGDGLGDIIRAAKEKLVPIQRVPAPKLSSLTNQNHQGIIAFGSLIQYQRLQDIIDQTYSDGQTPYMIWLDGVTDVRNMGAIARTAFCYGAHAIILTEKGNAAINEDAVKASAGALLQLPVVREKNNLVVIEILQSNGFHILGSHLDANDTLYKMPFQDPSVVVMGNEEEGISHQVYGSCSHKFIIPMSDKFDSLNVSVAAGIISNEVYRQRNS